jgi:hypothetical protein
MAMRFGAAVKGAKMIPAMFKETSTRMGEE